jgi:hypothetical protein
VAEALKELLSQLRGFRTALRGESTERVARRADKALAEQLASTWFMEICPGLGNAVGEDVLGRYSAHFKKLLELAGGNSRRTTYLRELDGLVASFRKDLVLPTQTTMQQSGVLQLLGDILGDLPVEESAYLSEAIACAQSGYLRASVVMGWCAAINRIHETIARLGFPRFNVASARIASESHGRFKRFNAPQNVSSVSDLRGVFDTQILWILEGMGLIDLNQHTRLRSCFDLRTQSAHPGDAPVTEYNLLSFFSDLNEIVFRNQAFGAV